MSAVLNQEARFSDYIHAVQALSDRDLFAQIAAGDEIALDELYHRYRSQVYRFLLHQTADAQAAQELIQDVFLAAWQGAGKFRGAASVKTWLLRVAYYRAASWVKLLDKVPDGELTDAIPSAGVPLDERIVQTWQTQTIREAMAELSAEQRTAVELIFYHELTYKEAAQVVECPVGTMKSRVNNALKNLAGHMLRIEITGT
ncbi:MAG TPA: sigma-70 family RNA polymerase sigma factor [Anaerolineales bacterium]|nr:sigma-70 family RNA polymerase sigma factor [Anaerolineales bacterium]